MSAPSSPTAGTPQTEGNGSTPPPSDQERFDQLVDRDSKIVLSILGGVAVLAALIMSTVALVQSSNKGTVTVTRASTPSSAEAPGAAASKSSPAGSGAAAKVIDMKVIPDDKKGPDGGTHDAVIPSDISVKAGETVELSVENRDDVPHSITSPGAGVNIVLLPGKHSYKLTVPTAGKFSWLCTLPCDEWAMAHSGYMAGYITAT